MRTLLAPAWHGPFEPSISDLTLYCEKKKTIQTSTLSTAKADPPPVSPVPTLAVATALAPQDDFYGVMKSFALVILSLGAPYGTRPPRTEYSVLSTRHMATLPFAHETYLIISSQLTS